MRLFRNNLLFRQLIILSPLVYLIHHFEEHIFFNFRDWRLTYFLDNNPYTSEEMLIRLAAFMLALIFFHQIKQNRASALLVLYFVMTTQVVNAIFHVFFSFSIFATSIARRVSFFSSSTHLSDPFWILLVPMLCCDL